MQGSLPTYADLYDLLQHVRSGSPLEPGHIMGLEKLLEYMKIQPSSALAVRIMNACLSQCPQAHLHIVRESLEPLLALQCRDATTKSSSNPWMCVFSRGCVCRLVRGQLLLVNVDRSEGVFSRPPLTGALQRRPLIFEAARKRTRSVSTRLSQLNSST